MARGLGTKSWSVGEVATASNLNTYLGPPPNIVDIDVFATAASNTNWDTNTVDTSCLYNGRHSSSGAQNDLIVYDVVLAAGTWTLEIMTLKASNMGIITASLSTDGSSFTAIDASPYLASASTFDCYSAGTTYNNRVSATGITIATTGRYALQLKMATKNASSSNYLGQIQHVRLRRTA